MRLLGDASVTFLCYSLAVKFESESNLEAISHSQ